MAYNYAYLRQYDKAIAFMAKYAASLPGDPNPEDSYAEILRLAGRFEQSIQHYRAALALIPSSIPRNTVSRTPTRSWESKLKPAKNTRLASRNFLLRKCSR